MTATWVDLPGLFPLRDGPSDGTKTLRIDAASDALQQRHEPDFLLFSVVLIFLVGSYLVCRYCRCRWLYDRNDRRRKPGTRSFAYTLYQSETSGKNDPVRGKVAMESVTVNPTRTKKTKALLVSEMEEPFLGPPEYQQPPPYELSPPAYDYLPSAPPLSDDANHSPKHL